MVNWKVRYRNKAWMVAFISQIMIVAQIFLEATNSLGLTHFVLTEHIQTQVLTAVNSMFVVLSMLGIIQDPTTKGFGDSDRAMTYEEPN